VKSSEEVLMIDVTKRAAEVFTDRGKAENVEAYPGYFDGGG
jgi:hypothetical protein